jgi:hypothetical protein
MDLEPDASLFRPYLIMHDWKIPQLELSTILLAVNPACPNPQPILILEAWDDDLLGWKTWNLFCFGLLGTIS